MVPAVGTQRLGFGEGYVEACRLILHLFDFLLFLSLHWLVSFNWIRYFGGPSNSIHLTG